MQNSIQVICHRKFGKVRVVILNGTVYFVGKDAAHALEFKDTSKAIRKHVKPQDKIVFNPVKTTGQTGNNPDKTSEQFENRGGVKIPQGAILINESGLWSLVMRSNMPQAQEMQHWLTSEVIPSIMKNGYYINPAVAAPIIQSTMPLSDFTKRETVEILLKLLPQANTPALKNQIIRHIDLILSPDYEKFLEQFQTVD